MTAAQSQKNVVAAFDFDGTLTRRDTLLPFLISTLGKSAVLRHALVLAPTLAGYGLGLIDNGVAKERVFIRCISGMQLEALRQSAARFSGQILPGLLRTEALQRLQWHRGQGHRCVVISASLELYVEPWARHAGFDDVIATKLEVGEGGRVTGRLSGENCYGTEKVRRLDTLLGPRDAYSLYAYGDSEGDRALLSFSDYPYFREMPG